VLPAFLDAFFVSRVKEIRREIPRLSKASPLPTTLLLHRATQSI
jgi:hypothetical protein